MNGGAINVSVSVSITLALAALAVALRLYARSSTKLDLGRDDILAVLAFVRAFNWGLGQSLSNLTDDNTKHDILAKSYLSLFLAELLYSLSICFSKLAILAFYWRMFKISNIRLPILVLAGMSIIWLVVRIFLTIFTCIPVQAFWDKTIKDAQCSVDESGFFFGTVLTHCLMDVAILLLPIIPVRHLRLRFHQKAVVMALFAFGILVCVASIILLVESLKFNTHTNDMPYDIVMIIIWSTVEVNLAIVSSNNPSLYLSIAISHNQHLSLPDRVVKLNILTRMKEADDTNSTHQLTELEDRRLGSNKNTHAGCILQDQQTVVSSLSCDSSLSGDATNER
ncbi:unnamed protein product [Clonostachys chloroleuca]|uniref:Rhodopsin domain-containing protein n=1 Tax=Clonostachys chloroleuca TaxID=1926264 RepID=A0AA35LPP2_9HYPO|nr:unnamed protein product [Clonostachys chloroleuca]